MSIIEQDKFIEDKYISLVPGKKRKGRPQLHTKEGRVYFLKDEIDEIRRDPQAFAQWMQSTYTLTPERMEELSANDLATKCSSAICYTLYGEILEVMKHAEAISLLYPNKEISFKISKKKLVPPTHPLYKGPISESIIIKGKSYKSITYQEFSSDSIYVYLTIE